MPNPMTLPNLRYEYDGEMTHYEWTDDQGNLTGGCWYNFEDDEVDGLTGWVPLNGLCAGHGDDPV